MEIEKVKTDVLIPYVRNARTHSDEQVAQICGSIKEFGFTNPVLIDSEKVIIAGHGRVMAAQRMGLSEVPCITLDYLTEAQKKAYIIADNQLALNAGWNEELLSLEIEELKELDYNLDLLGMSENEINNNSNLYDDNNNEHNTLSDKFGVPPFSILNAREGWWQNRKKSWVSLGIKSEEGRGNELLGFSSLAAKFQNNTSVFDPVLTELVYRWFSPINAVILDPFAGGSVRGIVASKLNRLYIGCELRNEQVVANKEQANNILKDNYPVWYNTDSRKIDKVCKDVKADLIFSCPPYADLEKYSDDENDLSNMNYDKFKLIYEEIIKKSCDLLKDDSFACFVVGEVRDKKGNYYNFVSDTINAFKKAGLNYYNEMILITAVGSLPIRIERQFKAGRKIGKTHQNVLVFVKGNSKQATEKCGECDFGETEVETEEQIQ